MNSWQLIGLLLCLAIGLLLLAGLVWVARASDDHAEESHKRYRNNP